MEKQNKNISVSHIVATVLICFTLIGLAVYGVYYNIKAERAERALENQYHHTFTDMADYVSSAEHYLLKALSTSTPGTMSAMLEEASKCSAQAESCLASLPIDQRLVEKISGYLVQLGDVAKTWSRRAVNGGALSADEYQTLTDLYGYAQDLSGGLYTLSNDLTQRSYSWANISNDSGKILDNSSLQSKYATLSKLSDPFSEYPTLIYDGPFSEHMTSAKPKGLTGNILSRAECQEKAVQLFAQICNCPVQEIKVNNCGENSYRNIETFCFTLSRENVSAHLDLTKTGGSLYSLILSRPSGDANLSPEQGIEAGKSFLQSIGLDSMSPSYYTIENNFITVNYSYEKNNILYYPDMVKVKIALDNGTPVGFEGHGYLACHTTEAGRIKPASISAEDAKAVLSSNLTIESMREVVVPNEFGGEYHAYEFKCTALGHPVLVYIDADTGAESEVLLILESENGILTI
ncbi:MAG: germination protein YpeB [Clostridiales bacterium]|jgi:germination protein ypeB|nr:germination protein YpeB [Clostridiales bacterium]